MMVICGQVGVCMAHGGRPFRGLRLRVALKMANVDATRARTTKLQHDVRERATEGYESVVTNLQAQLIPRSTTFANRTFSLTAYITRLETKPVSEMAKGCIYQIALILCSCLILQLGHPLFLVGGKRRVGSLQSSRQGSNRIPGPLRVCRRLNLLSNNVAAATDLAVHHSCSRSVCCWQRYWRVVWLIGRLSGVYC